MQESNSKINSIPCENANIQSKTLSECTPTVVESPETTIMTAILTEFDVQIPVESTITLQDNAIEIKRIKKDVILTQCKLVGGDTVFLKGYVRKNIEYATKQCENIFGKVVAGDIRHTTVNVNFHCSIPIDSFNIPPVIDSTTGVVETIFKERHCCCKDKREKELTHEAIYNEPIYCDLIQSTVIDLDMEVYDDYSTKCEVREFNKVVEKLLVRLTIRLLQDQAF